MAEASLALPQVQTFHPANRLFRLVPGILLLAAIGYLGKLAEQTLAAYAKTHHLHLPNIEYVLWAILIELVVSNTVGIPSVFQPGVSAIIATKGAIDADDEDSSYAIAAILALGAIALFTFPLIGHWLHLGDRAYGLWAGLAVDNTAEAAAAGALYSDAAGKIAVLAKTTRNAMIGFVVLGYALYWASKGQAQQVEGKALFLWRKFPKFVLGFLLVSLLATWGAFSKTELGNLANLSKWAFLLTFAGVGLRTNFRELKSQGLRPFLVGAIGEVVIAVVTLGLVFTASKLLHI